MTDFLDKLNFRFDHAALQPDATERLIIALCEEARRYELYAVAVNPVWVKGAASGLAGSNVKIVTVCAFPLGASRSDVKIAEGVKGVSDGAHEIDMVANIGWLVEGNFSKVEKEIAEVRRNLPYNIVLKVIIEAGKLEEQRQIQAALAVANGGAQFVKTSTGFFGGASPSMVAVLHRAAAGQIEVKASGGIRTLAQCRELLAAGASRLGSSSSPAIMDEYYRARKSNENR